MILGALTGTRAKGQVFGVLMGMTTLTGSASPLLFGLVADQAGLVTAVRLSVIPVALALGVVVAVNGMLGAARRPGPTAAPPG
jgi:fucose permease